MKVLAIIQAWNPDDPIRGFTVDWMRALAERVDEMVILALEDRSVSGPTTEDRRPTTGELRPRTDDRRPGTGELRPTTDDRRPTTGEAGASAEPTIYSLGKETTAGPFKRVRYLARWHRTVPRLLDDHDIDVIFTHMAPIYSVLAAPYARRRGIPVVTWFAHRAVTPTVRLAERLSARVASIDPTSFPLGGSRLRAIGHGIDTTRFAPGPLRGPIADRGSPIAGGAAPPIADRVLPIAGGAAPPIADRGSPIADDPGEAASPVDSGPARGAERRAASGSGAGDAPAMPPPPSRAPPLVLTVGRLSPAKGQMVLLEAVRRLLDQGEAVRCELVGGAPERDAAYAEQVRRRIDELGLRDFVSMPGPLPPAALPDRYRAAAAHVNCAAPDNALDKVVLEAAACGTPSLTSAGSARDTLGPHAEQLLFRAADPADLAAKLHAVLDLAPAARQELGRSLRQRVVERHSLDHLADALVEVFAEAKADAARDRESSPRPSAEAAAPGTPAHPAKAGNAAPNPAPTGIGDRRSAIGDQGSRPRTLAYLANARLPTEKAHGHQIGRMCEAFAGHGLDVTLVHPGRDQPEPLRGRTVFDYYGLAPTFEVRALPAGDVHALERRLPGPLFQAAYLAASLRWAGRAAVAEPTARADLAYTRDPAVAWRLARSRRPFVYEAHGIPRRVRRRLLRQALAAPSLRLVVALTTHLRDRLIALGAPADRVIVAPDAVDLDRFRDLPDRTACRRRLGLPQHTPIVGYIGRWRTVGGEKGMETLIRAVAKLKDGNATAGRDNEEPGEPGNPGKKASSAPNAAPPGLGDPRSAIGDRAAAPSTGPILICVGGPMDVVPDYQAIAEDAGLPPDRLRLVDRVPPAEVPCWIRACDIATIPWPRTEHAAYFTSPLKLFEYMAAGTPIVASDLPSLRDVLTHGENAWLVAPGDADALAEGVAGLLREPERARRLAARASADVRKHTWHDRTARILQALEDGRG